MSINEEIVKLEKEFQAFKKKRMALRKNVSNILKKMGCISFRYSHCDEDEQYEKWRTDNVPKGLSEEQTEQWEDEHIHDFIALLCFDLLPSGSDVDQYGQGFTRTFVGLEGGQYLKLRVVCSGGQYGEYYKTSVYEHELSLDVLIEVASFVRNHPDAVVVD